MQIFDIVEELEKERNKNKELEDKIEELKKYKKAYINEAGLTHILTYRINKVIDYIEKYLQEHIIDDLPDEESKFETEDGIPIPNAKEQLLNILKGDNK